MTIIYRGVAQFGLERYLGVVEIGGSNPLTPIILRSGTYLRRALSKRQRPSADALVADATLGW